MKIFLDSSDSFFIVALIDNENKIIDFMNIKTNNDLIKNSILIIEKFFKKNKIKINDITEFFLTIGPGSFTGVKIPLNICKTFNIVNKLQKIYVIDSLKLLKIKNSISYISYSKEKIFIKKRSFFLINKIYSIKKETIFNKDKNSFETFSGDDLQKKIDLNSFKKVNNINKIKIKYSKTIL